jgi:hypothetical protein
MSDVQVQIISGLVGVVAGGVILAALLMLPEIIRHGWRNDR